MRLTYSCNMVITSKKVAEAYARLTFKASKFLFVERKVINVVYDFVAGLFGGGMRGKHVEFPEAAIINRGFE